MADSVKESILKNIKTTLEGITVANLFQVDVKNVQRFQVQGQNTVEKPFIIVIQGEVITLDEGPYPQVTKEMTVYLDVFDSQDVSVDLRNADEIMNVFEADIERALQADPGRGGYASDTSPIDSLPLTVAQKGATDIETEMRFKVIFRHRREDQTKIV